MSGLPDRLLLLILAGLASYLIGSVPFGLVLTRLGGAGDIRTIGSGNIGATNVLRTGRRGLAAATLLLDALKGIVAVLLAALLLPLLLPDVVAVGAVCVVAGHCFPVWLRFRGGKGVATGLGVAAGAGLAGRAELPACSGCWWRGSPGSRRRGRWPGSHRWRRCCWRSGMVTCGRRSPGPGSRWRCSWSGATAATSAGWLGHRAAHRGPGE